jgi:membrane-associated protease RseP (regulator of RpoE activity)
MNRRALLVCLSFATFVGAFVASQQQAEAQLFRRIRAAIQQPARQPQYRQPANEQQYQQPGYQQPQSRAGRNPSNQSTGKIPSANYSRVPKALGKVRFADQDPRSNRDSSKSPTLAKEPKKVTDNLDGDEASSDASRRTGTENDKDRDAEEESSGKSILSRSDDDESPRKATATMGLEVYQMPEPQNGVRIARITERSFADESGLRVGDLIVAVGDKRTRQVKDIATILKSQQPGTSLRVQFVRGDTAYLTSVPLIVSEYAKKATTKQTAPPGDRVTVAKPPTSQTDTPSKTTSASKPVKLGMMIQDPKSLRGTSVTNVRQGSIADASGLEVGDRIVSVESKLLAGSDQLREIVSDLTWGDELAVGIVRDGELISRKIKLIEPTTSSLAKSAPERTAVSDVGKGIGAMLGGMFAGSGKAKKDQDQGGDDKNAVVSAEHELPSPANSEDLSADPLDFGDDEPIEQVIFQVNAGS